MTERKAKGEVTAANPLPCPTDEELSAGLVLLG
jgi:hypothetical protein